MIKRVLAVLLTTTLTACATTQAETTRVYISDGSKQCLKVNVPINEHLALLTENNVDASNPFCAELNGMSYMSVCGGATGKIHVFDIDVNDLTTAKALGFKEADKLRPSVSIKPRQCPAPAKTPNKKVM